MKKLRDAQEMNKIASYYLKTLFLWEVMKQNNPGFWRQNPTELFKIMVSRLNDAVDMKEIPYFWNRDNNLIANVKKSVLKQYSSKLKKIKNVLSDPSKHKMIPKFLLTSEEFEEYQSCNW